ncbi:SRPBCC domain-containing protein [uncultured Shimia sp.]|uniref:SRPBCC family protein n=1 Tax=uncultured Shimia sp. TaxID=573152 RepID=UPI0025F50ADC|nr:SRPBCC domain-containing protein [uncultured Shimia sp.]
MTLDTTMAELSQDTTIRKSVFLAAPKTRVWEFLTKADLLNEWFHPAEKDLAEGEDYTLTSQKDGDRMCWGKVVKATPHDYMKWDFTVGPMDGAMSTVEWELSEAPGGTRLTLIHSGLPTNVDGFGLVMALDKGWHGFLSNLHDMQ